jgi:predicted transposase/invertase (TIGR01784 family)
MNYAKKAGLEKGMKKGLEQGLEQGERQKAQAIAVKLLNRGMTVKEISEITSLSLEEIEGMKK